MRVEAFWQRLHLLMSPVQPSDASRPLRGTSGKASAALSTCNATSVSLHGVVVVRSTTERADSSWLVLPSTRSAVV